MAKKKKKSATRTSKSAHRRREDEVVVPLSAVQSPPSSLVNPSGLHSKIRSPVTASPSKYLASPPNAEGLERVEMEDCSEDEYEEEELDYEDSEENLHSGFKFFSSRATVHATEENLSLSEMASLADLGQNENLPLDASLANEGQDHGQNLDLVGEGLLDLNLNRGNGNTSNLVLNSENVSRVVGRGSNAGGTSLPRSGKGFATLGSSMGAAEAGSLGLESSTPPVCSNGPDKSFASAAARTASFNCQRDKQPTSYDVPRQATVPSAPGGTRPDPSSSKQPNSGNPSASGSAQWRDLFANNRSAESCLKLSHYEAITEQGSCILF